MKGYVTALMSSGFGEIKHNFAKLSPQKLRKGREKSFQVELIEPFENKR